MTTTKPDSTMSYTGEDRRVANRFVAAVDRVRAMVSETDGGTVNDIAQKLHGDAGRQSRLTTFSLLDRLRDEGLVDYDNNSWWKPKT